LFRTHATRFPALPFRRTLQNRFDAAGGEFGVLYLGAAPYSSFIETFGQETGVRFVTVPALATRSLSEVRCKRKLRLIDLASGGGLARVGADGRLGAGGHAIAQHWSRALWGHRVRPDGLCCPARHDPARKAVALYDRAARSLAVERKQTWSRVEPVLLGSILDRYRFGLVKG